MSHAAPASGACYNCSAPLTGAYCAACGQKALPLNPRLHDFLHDFTHEMLHVDGKRAVGVYWIAVIAATLAIVLPVVFRRILFA